MDFNTYFDKIYCINLDRRPDRWETVKEKFDKLNIKVERFSACDGNDLPPEVLQTYQGINKYEVACMISHYNVIKDAKQNNYTRILILEDDVMFAQNFMDKFFASAQKLPDDYKIWYLGASQFK